jgi:hypothetical protein
VLIDPFGSTSLLLRVRSQMYTGSEEMVIGVYFLLMKTVLVEQKNQEREVKFQFRNLRIRQLKEKNHHPSIHFFLNAAMQYGIVIVQYGRPSTILFFDRI